jgi:hypothetical protein
MIDNLSFMSARKWPSTKKEHTAGVYGSTRANATASIPAVVNATVPGGTDAIVKGAKDAAGKVVDVANQAGGIAGAINGNRT